MISNVGDNADAMLWVMIVVVMVVGMMIITVGYETPPWCDFVGWEYAGRP